MNLVVNDGEYDYSSLELTRFTQSISYVDWLVKNVRKHDVIIRPHDHIQTREHFNRIKKYIMAPHAVRFLFGVAQNILPDMPEVRHHCVQLMTHFLFLQCVDLRDFIVSRKEKQQEYLDSIQQKMLSQIILRAVGVAQICCKFHTNHINRERITNPYLCAMLRSMGQSFTNEGMLKSEIRILKTVDHRVNCFQNPVDELLIYLNQIANKICHLPLQEMWHNSVALLDHCVVHGDHLLTVCCQLSIGFVVSNKEKMRYGNMLNRSNLLLLSILACSSLLLSNSNVVTIYVEVLRKAAEIASRSPKELHKLVTIIILMQEIEENDYQS